MDTRRLPEISRCLAAVLIVLAATGTASAQTEHAGHQPAAQPAERWEWRIDANVFAGWNYQYRRFRDFQEIESQNWLMATGARRTGPGQVRLHAMFSFEPLTIQDIGSPQVFQTGETFERAALVDYQHPHDLFMGLGATYARPLGRFETLLEGSLVGSPSIGPGAFMHRASAAENPTAPLSHHQMDATHITHGVVRAGIARNGIELDASWFRGAEPDENRYDLDLGALDSWATRLGWRRGPWYAQASFAYLTEPEWIEPGFDVKRVTASVAYTSGGGRLATLLAWGRNRKIYGPQDAYLFEATAWLTGRDAAYTRAEVVNKDMSASGQHAPGAAHVHPLSRVGALTLGYVRDLRVAREGRWGVGGDVTAYRVPANLTESYGSPASFHLFLRYRPRANGAAHHH